MNFCIMLLFDTGMRCNEMILMEPEDIKPDYILVKHGKDSKERVVPKSPALSKQLIKYRTLRDPLEIAQYLGRKRTLDADDTCTVYFRDYGLDWYWGTSSGLKKFRNSSGVRWAWIHCRTGTM